MPDKIFPVYSICSLSASASLPEDFIADNFAHYLQEHKNLHFPHKHSFYHLVYFTKGSGSHSIDFVNFPVKAGQIYFMVPGQVHDWNFKNVPDGFIVNFSEQYINALIADTRYLDQFSFFSGIAAQQVINIPVKAQPAVEQLLSTIISEAQGDKLQKDDMIRTALLQLFILVNRSTNHEKTTTAGNYNSLLLQNFRKLIDQQYKKLKLTKEYAALLYVTPNHLNALSKHVTGQSAGELIRDRVLLEAKRLLVNAQLNISEIARELDFADNSYFARFFKKYTGLTPDEFRKQNIKK